MISDLKDYRFSGFLAKMLRKNTPIVLLVLEDLISHKFLCSSSLQIPLGFPLNVIVIGLILQFIFNLYVFQRKFKTDEGTKLSEQVDDVVPLVMNGQVASHQGPIIVVLISHVLIRFQLDLAVFEPEIAELLPQLLDLRWISHLQLSEGPRLLI